MYFHPLFIYIVVPYTKTAIIMFDIIFVLVFGRLQASGTLNFPDRLYPIWKWAVGAGMLYAAIGTMLGYAFSGSFSLVSFLLIIALSSIWFSLYFKLLRLTASKTVLNQCISGDLALFRHCRSPLLWVIFPYWSKALCNKLFR